MDLITRIDDERLTHLSAIIDDGYAGKDASVLFNSFIFALDEVARLEEALRKAGDFVDGKDVRRYLISGRDVAALATIRSALAYNKG